MLKSVRCRLLLPLLLPLVLLNVQPATGQRGAPLKPSPADSLRERLRARGLTDTAQVHLSLALVQALDDENAPPAERKALLLNSLQLARRIGFVGGELKTLNYLVMLALQTSDLLHGQQYYNRAIRRAHQTGETRFLAETLYGLAGVAIGQQESARGIGLYEQAITAAERLTPYYRGRTLETSLAGAMAMYLEFGRLPDARRRFRRLLALTRQQKDDVTAFVTMVRWGTGLRKYAPDSAAMYLQQATQMAGKLGIPYYQAFASLGLMQVRQQQKRWPETLRLARQALRLARLSQTPDYEAGALEGLAEAMRHLGQAPAAFDTLQRAYALFDTLSSKEKRAEFARQQVAFEVGEKEARIRKLEQQRRIGQLEADRQRTRTYALLLGLLGATGFSALLWRQRRRLQASEARLQAANHTKDQLIRIVGHDLRSPMASLQQLTPLLHDLFEQPPAERAAAHHLIRTLDAGAQHLGGMVDNLFQWARAQGGQLINHPESLRVAFAVQSIGALYGPMAQLKGITLTVSTTPSDLVAVADLGLLTTVLRNLVGNALKFTPKNGQVQLRAEATPDGQVAFSVLDTGPGFAPERLPALLAADQLPSTPGTNGEPGTGLGLPLSARFVRLLGGELAITSVPGEGTRAAFRLPGRAGAAQRGA